VETRFVLNNIRYNNMYIIIMVCMNYNKVDACIIHAEVKFEGTVACILRL